MKKHYTFEECVELAGEEPEYVEPILNWVCSKNGVLTSFDTKEGAETHGGIIKEIIVNQIEVDKHKEEHKQFAGKVHEIWFFNLIEEFEPYGLNEVFWDIYQYIESEHEIMYSGFIDPDEIYESMVRLLNKVVEPLIENVLTQVSATRNAFYFKSPKGGYVKL
jgi:hypothetical protein